MLMGLIGTVNRDSDYFLGKINGRCPYYVTRQQRSKEV